MKTCRAVVIFVSLLMATSVNAAPLVQRLELQGIVFDVHASQTTPTNELTIQPHGLSADNRAIRREVDELVSGMEVADLNADGAPEVFVFLTSPGSGSYGNLIGYASNNRKSLSEIYLPSLLDSQQTSQGYMGHDEFAIVENRLGRRFPVYRPGDSNSRPTGGVRVVYYKLVPGESGWRLDLAEIMNFPNN